MAIKLVKKTADYTIYQRGDNRYAVRDCNRNPVNGAEKARILLTEELIKVTLPSESPAQEPAPHAEQATPLEEAGEGGEDSPAGEGGES